MRRNVACGSNSPTLVLRDRRQVRQELRPLQQSGKSDDHHAGNVIGLSTVVKLFSSVGDDDVDPVTNHRKLGVQILTIMEPHPILPGTRSKASPLTLLVHSGTASRAAAVN